MHCKSGADRAGFAAGVFLLLHGGSADDALRQLSWRFGHVRQSRTGILDAVFAAYREQAEGRLGFAEWARTEYEPEALCHRLPANALVRAVGDLLLRRE